MFKSVGKVVDLRDYEDAIEACGLNWRVYKGDVSHRKPDGNLVSCPNFAGVFRADTEFNLGMVGIGYALIQNDEAASITKEVLEQDANLRIIRGGEIFQGDKMFLNLRIGNAIQIGSELFERIVMIAWAHDGGLSVTARFFLIRKSTGAILNVDSPEIQTSIKIRHTGKTNEKIKIAQNILKAAYKFFENIESKMEVLSFTPLTDGDFKGLLSKIFPDSESGEGKGQTRIQNKRDEVFGLYKGGNNSANVQNTKLGGLLAITEYCNGEKSTRVCKDKNPEEVELNGILFGTRTAEINKMFKGLLEAATA
jgi:phage/plasmid-like protein (TIGR03299 family)